MGFLQWRLTGYTTHSEVQAPCGAADGQHKTGLRILSEYFVGFSAPVLVLCLNIILSIFVFWGCSCVGVSVCIYASLAFALVISVPSVCLFCVILVCLFICLTLP